MKKIITLVVAIAFATTAFSQFAFQAGGNLSTFSGDSKNKLKLGYQVGFLKELGDWGDRLTIEPGLFLVHKGARWDADPDNIAYRLNYLQVPLNTKINFYLGEAKIFVGYGIYGACGLWGSRKMGKEKTDIEWGNDHYKIRRFDFGGQVMIGMVSGQMGANFTYQPGARGIRKDSGVHNTSYMLNFTYYFSDPRY
jgi:hypothetical protein